MRTTNNPADQAKATDPDQSRPDAWERRERLYELYHVLLRSATRTMADHLTFGGKRTTAVYFEQIGQLQAFMDTISDHQDWRR